MIGATCRREGQVRLVGGSTSNEGRVEICIQGVWGSICRNSWGTAESAIVCEQLGFQSESKSISELNPLTGSDALLNYHFMAKTVNTVEPIS